jgi:hypothetical protein
MDFYKIQTIAHYEAKILSREILWKIFVLFTLTLVLYFLLPTFQNFSWNRIALDSSLPFTGIYYFNLLQVLFVIFACGNSFKRRYKQEALVVMNIYPVDNSTLFFGQALGIFRKAIFLNIIAIIAIVIVHLLVYAIPFKFGIYLFYFLTISFPTLVFSLGFSFLVFLLVRHYFLALVIIMACWICVYFVLADELYGLFDPLARMIPNAFSSFTGHVNLLPYLSQRFIYILWGIGCLYVSIKLYPRIPNNYRKILMSFLTGGGYIFVGFILLVFCIYVNVYKEDIREKYRGNYQAYQNSPHVNTIRHDIIYYPQKTGFSASSKLVLENSTQQDLDYILLFLNQGLRVSSIRCDSVELAFQRNDQVVRVDRQLAVGEIIVLDVKYEGDIDEDICYLDIPTSDFQNPANNSHTIQYYGRRFAFCTSEYTLLTPECLWYPVSVPPVNIDLPLCREVNFTTYNLIVKNPPKKTIISQGEKIENENEVSFVNVQPLHGISLVIGEYRQKTILHNNIEIRLYYSPLSQFILDDYSSWELPSSDYFSIESTLEQIQYAADYALKGNYPFKRFSIIECPISFTMFPRWWNKISSFTQPEFSFMPERGAVANYLPPYMYKKNHSSSQPGEAESNSLRSFMTDYLQDTKIKFGSQTQELSSFISSPVYPGIDLIMKELASLGARSNYVLGGYDKSKVQATGYFNAHSLREAITTPPEGLDFSSLFVYKIMDLQAEISREAKWNDIQLFLTDFIHSCSFTTVDFETLKQKFFQRFNFDFSVILDKWYNKLGVPEFVLKDIEYKFVKIEDEYSSKLHFKVHNSSEIDGIISVINSPARHQEMEIVSYAIKAGECKEIRAWFDNMTLQLFSTNLSLDIPSDLPREHIMSLNKHLTYTTDTITGIFDVNLSDFYSKPNEIIVDNMDDNFTLVDSSGQRQNLMSLLKKDEDRYSNHFVDKNTRWREMIDIGFYGKSIKSAFCKEAGKGMFKAEWHTKIPKEGIYEIYAYLPMKSEYYYTTHGYGARLYYEVLCNNENHQIIIDANEENSGWVSLGRYTFSKDYKSVVTLDDRGGDIGYSLEKKEILGNDLPPLKQIIIADAMKWVFVTDSISGL